MPSDRPDMTWPMYFAKVACDGKGKVRFRDGDPFPIQDKAYIRGIGASFGCKDSWARSFGDLPYVEVLNVYSDTMARHISERGLTLEQARRLVRNGEASAPGGQQAEPAASAPSPTMKRKPGRPRKVRPEEIASSPAA